MAAEVNARVVKLKAERDKARREAAAERHKARELKALNTELRRQLRALTGASVSSSGEIGVAIGVFRDC